jgi:Transposase DDE domain
MEVSRLHCYPLEDQPLKNRIRNTRMQESIERFRCSFLQTGREKLFNVLPARDLACAVEEEVDVWRNRLYSPLVTLRLFVEQMLHADHACQDVVVRYASERVAQGEAQVSLSTGPYCNARLRLPLELVARVGMGVGKRLESASTAAWRWRGRAVKIVDGTTVTMPDTKDNQACYPQHGGQKSGLGFPIARLVALVSLGCGAVLDWAMGPCKGKQTGEDALFRQLYGSLVKGDILLADRYHCSYFTIAALQLMRVDVLTRQHARRVTDFRRGQRLGKRDHLVVWERPARPAWMAQEDYARMPEELVLREARVAQWVLVSTMLDAQQVSKEELNALYVQRWHIELDLRAIKTVMGMEIMRCKSASMVQKEVGAYFLAYNLIRAAMAQAAACAKLLPRQLSFCGAKRMVNGFMDLLRGTSARGLTRMFAYLRGAIALLLLPHRPNRVEPRAVKRRPKPHRLLTEHRNVARTKLRRARPCFA